MNYNEIMANGRINRVANYILKKYCKCLTPEELEQCKLIGIWKASINYNGKSSISTYVYNCIRWECCRAIREHVRNHKVLLYNNLDAMAAKEPIAIDLDILSSATDRRIIFKKYIENRTVKEIAEELSISAFQTRKRIKKSITMLKRALS